MLSCHTRTTLLFFLGLNLKLGKLLRHPKGRLPWRRYSINMSHSRIVHPLKLKTITDLVFYCTSHIKSFIIQLHYRLVTLSILNSAWHPKNESGKQNISLVVHVNNYLPLLMENVSCLIHVCQFRLEKKRSVTFL